MDDNEKRNTEKVEFFLSEGVRVHVERKDRRFWNGTITQKKSDGVYGFMEDKFGARLLFISDIWEIDEYLEEAR